MLDLKKASGFLRRFFCISKPALNYLDEFETFLTAGALSYDNSNLLLSRIS